MLFSSHINNIISKASCVLNLIRRNLSKCSKEIKNIAYLSLVRPILQDWAHIHADTATDVISLEKIQRRATGWVMSDYGRTSSVTSTLSDLQWTTLSDRRRSAIKIIYFLQNYSSFIITTITSLLHYSKSANTLLSPTPLHYQ